MISSSTDALVIVTATDSLPENEGETRRSPGGSLRTGLGFGFTGSGRFMSILLGASGLGALLEGFF